MLAAPHAPAELVQLAQAEALRALDQDHRGVGDVNAHLDHRGADQDVVLVAAEGGHDLLFLARLHPPVQQRQPVVGEDLG